MKVDRKFDEQNKNDWISKVPQVTLMFWVIKIFATTLGDTLTKPHEVGGFNLGRVTSSLTIAVVMIVLVFLTYRNRGKLYPRAEP
ncbi:MAG TPA: hypothetical protein VF779_10045 [Pyrinomonadaceae bacterium]